MRMSIRVLRNMRLDQIPPYLEKYAKDGFYNIKARKVRRQNGLYKVIISGEHDVKGKNPKLIDATTKLIGGRR